MTWTEDDPGAGDLEAVRALARRLDETAQQVADIRRDARSHTGDVTEQAWSGTAGDAWRRSAETCVDNLGRLTDSLGAAADVLTGYASRVEEIAQEAEDTRRARSGAQGLLLTMRPLPTDATAVARRRWIADHEEARYAVRNAGYVLEELADRRRSADAALCADLGTVDVGDWGNAGPVGVGSGVPGPTSMRDHAAEMLGIHPGSLALGQSVKDGLRLGTKSSAYAQYVRAAFAPVDGRQRAALRWRARYDAGLERFRYGNPNGGVLGRVIGVRAATIAGRFFLPLTALSGLDDIRTGGGYDGARGVATRAFGAVGAVGAIGVLAMSNPIGLTIAGAAVLAYGAWSLGNLIWDNREAMGDFLSSAASWVGDAWDTAGSAVAGAVDWARDKVGQVTGKVADGLADLGKGALSVLSFGAL